MILYCPQPPIAILSQSTFFYAALSPNFYTSFFVPPIPKINVPANSYYSFCATNSRNSYRRLVLSHFQWPLFFFDCNMLLFTGPIIKVLFGYKKYLTDQSACNQHRWFSLVLILEITNGTNMPRYAPPITSSKGLIFLSLRSSKSRQSKVTVVEEI